MRKLDWEWKEQSPMVSNLHSVLQGNLTQCSSHLSHCNGDKAARPWYHQSLVEGWPQGYSTLPVCRQIRFLVMGPDIGVQEHGQGIQEVKCRVRTTSPSAVLLKVWSQTNGI